MTPSLSDYVAACAAAYCRLTDAPLERRMLGCMWAQYALETGRGKSLKGNNVGNIRAGKSWTGDVVRFDTHEVINGQDELQRAQAFRAYPTLEDGCYDYLTLLSTRYTAAWERACAGDPVGFVRALKAGGYFTGNADAYTHAVVSLVCEFERLAVPVPPRPHVDEGYVYDDNRDTLGGDNGALGQDVDGSGQASHSNRESPGRACEDER